MSDPAKLSRLLALWQIIWLCLCQGVEAAPAANAGQLDEDALNLYCLRRAYPQISGVRMDASGRTYLAIKDGTLVPYDEPGTAGHSSLAVGVRESMAQLYPLEPVRPDMKEGFAPGRKRPYALLRALYGDSPAAVQQHLVSHRFLGRDVRLARNAAEAFGNALADLEKLAASGELRRYLVPEGGYYWRNIAGEKAQSAHSFGIALDIGVKHAPYWRWSREMPHPMQKTYPAEIVEIMERHGFIWGGKWREYDLMHFEYRPELICKARLAGFIQPQERDLRP